MSAADLTSSDRPHRRFNPLTGEWVLVSPQRTRRPWQGQTEEPHADTRLPYDETCYLCPGVLRAGGARNPDYQGPHVFTNDFPALLPDGGDGAAGTGGRGGVAESLLVRKPVRGTSRVICFSERHDRTLPEMAPSDIRRVIDVWAEQTEELGATYRWVQVFENKGEVMGCSNPHPHGQIWALDDLPNEAAREDARQRAYLEKHDRPLLVDYAALESERRERVVVENEHWLAVVPFWAVWPFETLLLPRRHVPRLPALEGPERDALAAILNRLLTRYDNLFRVSFPYSMGWHGAPYAGAGAVADDTGHWQLHAHIYPPLLRSATVKKFMVGFEMLGEPQRDLTAEVAAGHLRQLSETHYRHGGTG